MFHKRNTVLARAVTRVIDIVFSLAGVLISAPLFIACAIAIKLDSAGPVLFRQVRVGQYGHEFTLLKFRSMINGADGNGSKVTFSGDARVTRVGRWLRATKIDELPQLCNVLCGHMALVGPRPEVPQYVSTYTPSQKQILMYKPGITGPASLGYIYEEALLAASSHPESFYQQQVLPHKIQLDLDYCETASLSTDVGILAMTIKQLVFRPKNIVHNTTTR